MARQLVTFLLSPLLRKNAHVRCTRLCGLVTVLAIAVMLDIGSALAQDSPPQNSTAPATAPFNVEGTIINGTANGTTPAGLEVQVAAFTSDNGAVQTWSGQSDADGHYRIEGIDRVANAEYLVGVDYSDTTYGDHVDPPTVGDTVTVDVDVYETVQTDPGLRFDQSAIVISGIDQSNQTLSLLEFHSIVNPTDHTFAPSPNGPGGPSGLLVFGLPPGAFGLTAEFGLDPSRLIQIDRGVASLEPIVPGRTEIGFTYQIPYSSAAEVLQRTIRYPVGRFLVFSPLPGPGLQSDQLGTKQTSDVSGRQYLTVSGGPFNLGTPISVTVTDLPVRGGPFAAVPPVAVAAGGLAIGLAAVGLALGRRRAMGQRSLRTDARLPVQEDVVERIVALDLAYEQGHVAEEEYHAARAALMHEAALQASSAVSTAVEEVSSSAERFQ